MEHMESCGLDEMVKRAVEMISRVLLWSSYCVVPAYLVHGSASEVNRSGDDVQVISCHCYPVFHPLVEQLPSSISLNSFSSLPSPSILRDHEWHVPERYINYAKTCIFQS